jgi:hypothetical protein
MKQSIVMGEDWDCCNSVDVGLSNTNHTQDHNITLVQKGSLDLERFVHRDISYSGYRKMARLRNLDQRRHPHDSLHVPNIEESDERGCDVTNAIPPEDAVSSWAWCL